jgi:hypothetical protein
MCARVNHCIGRVIVGEVRVVGITVEGELKHPRSGQFEFIPERTDLGSDEPQVLSNERQIP